MRKPAMVLFLLFSIVAFSIVIKTNEKGVEVYLNNEHEYTIDGTSLILQREGMANIKLSLPGYWPVNYELKNVDLSSTKVIEVNFYPLTEATITGIPEGARIYIMDGSVEVLIGEAPYKGALPLGRHVFKVVTPSNFKYTVEKNITTDTQVISLHKVLSKTFVIDSIPKAALYIDGIYRGITPVTITLRSKDHTFKFYSKKFLVGSCKLEITDEDIRILKKNVVGMEKDRNRLIFRLRKVVRTSIHSVPEGAFFKLNGKIYRTPEFLELPESTNVVEVFMPGYKSKKLTLNIAKNPYVNINLEPDRKNIQLNSHGEVFVDGICKGTAPTVINLICGIHILELVNGENRWLNLVDISNDVKVNVNKDDGTLVIGDIGIVKLNGSSVLTPAILNLPPGNYEISRTLKDGTSMTETITVKKGRITYYPKSAAILFVKTSPPGIMVKLDEKRYTTPIVLIPVEPGKISLEFQYKCATLRKTVKVEGDKINFVRADFNIIFNEREKGCPVSIEEK